MVRRTSWLATPRGAISEATRLTPCLHLLFLSVSRLLLARALRSRTEHPADDRVTPTASDGTGDAAMALDRARSDGYNFVTTSLSRNGDPASLRRSDVLRLRVEEWSRLVVGQFDADVSTGGVGTTTTSIDGSCEWAAHMGIPAVILPPLPTSFSPVDADSHSQNKGNHQQQQPNLGAEIHNYAATVARQATKESSPSSFQLWVPVRLSQLREWQLVYRMCEEHPRIGMMLVLEPSSSAKSSGAPAVTSGSVASPMDTANSESPQQQQRNDEAPVGNKSQTNSTSQQLRLLHTAIGAAPIRAVMVPTSLFLTNKKGFPTLSRSNQIFVTELLKRIGRTTRFVVQGPSRHYENFHNKSNGNIGDETPAGSTLCKTYLQYLQHLRKRKDVTDVLDSPEAKLEYNDDANYLDALQRPLQPLKDHLENQTYDVFEKDPVKYSQYRRAAALALRERLSAPSMPQQQQLECVFYVVGAGRGPLVTCVLQAYQEVVTSMQQQLAVNNVKLTVVAVEKNPSAMIYLYAKAEHDQIWKSAVDAGCSIQLVCKDLRNLTLADVGGKRCDVVVSELLGSFGDNELSPECLDAFFASEVVKRETVSIPRQYVSHLSLVSSAQLHSLARNQALYPDDSSESNVIGMQKAMETPYVVRPHAASQMQEEQDCWSFIHPSTNNQDLSRQRVLDFVPYAGVGAGLGSGYGTRDRIIENAANFGEGPLPSPPWTLSGLLGTFTADLYSISKDGQQESSVISTAPSNFSVGMFSWFPLYFPLSQPVHVPSAASVRVYIWRRIDPALHRVWYEWSVAVYRGDELLSMTPIHNPGGRSYHVSM